MQHPVLAGLISGYGWLLGILAVWIVGAAYVHLRQRLHRMQSERNEGTLEEPEVLVRKPQQPQVIVQPRKPDQPKVVVDDGIPQALRRQPTEEELQRREEQRRRDRERNRQPVVN